MFTGEDVKAYRKAQKLSVAKFAEMLGITPTKLYNIEKGREMKPSEVEALTPYMDPGVTGASPPATQDPAPAASVTPGQDVHLLTEDELDDDPGEFIEQTATAPAPVSAPTVADEPQAPVLTVPSSAERIAAFPGRLFSNSELKTWKRCRRKYWLAYIRRLGLKYETPVGARQLGTVVHTCLAGWYVPEGQERVHPLTTLAQVVAIDRERVDPNDPDMCDEFDKQSELARIMLEGYMEWLGETGADSAYEVIAPEATMISPLPDDTFDVIVGLIGKLDVRLVRTIDNARLFMDHKTVGSLTEPVRTLHMDEQMLQYDLLEWLDLLQAEVDPLLAERTDGALYNMLKKVKRTDRAKPPFYDRVEVRHNPHSLASYYARVIGEIRDILDAQGRLESGESHQSVMYPNPTGDCTWDCDFFHACSMFDDGSRVDDFLHEHYVEVSILKRYEHEIVENGAVDA